MALIMVLRIKERGGRLAEFEPGACLPPQLADVPLHRPPCRLVPLRHELPPELLGIATPSIPSPSQVWDERPDQERSAVP